VSNPNSPLSKMKKNLEQRWLAEDYPGARPQFQFRLLAADFGVYLFLPILAIVFFKSCEDAFSSEKRSKQTSQKIKNSSETSDSRSQIIDFGTKGISSGTSGIARKAPGALVKVRLLNVVETYGNAPVHAQVVDEGLGRKLLGSTLIGDAVSDTNFDRINITFRHLRDLKKEGFSIPISARALSLNGTLGLVAQKKEEFFARAALGSGSKVSQEADGKSESTDLKQLIARALTSGLLQEFGSESQVAHNRSKVLTLKPLTEFFVELTDYFPGNNK
jgi:hypothetical protein